MAATLGPACRLPKWILETAHKRSKAMNRPREEQNLLASGRKLVYQIFEHGANLQELF